MIARSATCNGTSNSKCHINLYQTARRSIRGITNERLTSRRLKFKCWSGVVCFSLSALWLDCSSRSSNALFKEPVVADRRVCFSFFLDQRAALVQLEFIRPIDISAFGLRLSDSGELILLGNLDGITGINITSASGLLIRKRTLKCI